jgi:hypothetical protein
MFKTLEARKWKLESALKALKRQRNEQQKYSVTNMMTQAYGKHKPGIDKVGWKQGVLVSMERKAEGKGSP